MKGVESRFEQASHQVSCVIAEIKAQEAKADDDIVSKISNSFDGASERSTKKWQQVIGVDNMRKLLDLDDKERNRMMELFNLFSLAADSDEELKNYATAKLNPGEAPPPPVKTPRKYASKSKSEFFDACVE